MDKKNIENRLIAPMIKHLTGEGIDLAQDYLEITLDTISRQRILKELPLIKTLYGFKEITVTVKNLIMARNYCVFISDLRKDQKTDAELQKHISNLNGNPKQLQKELEMLLVYLEQYKEVEKAQYMANIYRAYLNCSVTKINWETAMAFFEILDRILLQDIDDLKRLIEKGTSKENFKDHSGLLRLSALGLLQYFDGKEEKYGHNKNGLARITTFGKCFYRVIETGKTI